MCKPLAVFSFVLFSMSLTACTMDLRLNTPRLDSGSLTPDPDLDSPTVALPTLSLRANYGFNNDANAIVWANSEKSALYIGGNFTRLHGESKSKLVRVYLNGAVDPSFDIGTGFNGDVETIAVDSQNRVLVGGDFTDYNGTPATRLIRLLPDGNIDSTFNVGSGFDGNVRSIAITSAGDIFVGGWFFSVNGAAQKSFALLDENGSVKSGFNNNGSSILMGAVDKVLVAPDGRLVFGGSFIVNTTLNGSPTTQSYLMAMDQTGAFDPQFLPAFSGPAYIYDLEFEASGKLLVAGRFQPDPALGLRNGLARYDMNGTADASFATGSAFNMFSTTYDIQIAPNGKILALGNFTSFNGVSVKKMVFLNADGSLDNTWVPRSNVPGENSNFCEASSAAIDDSGKIFFVGNFMSCGNVPQVRFGKLAADGLLNRAFLPARSFRQNSTTPAAVSKIVKDPSSGGAYLVGQFTEYDGTPVQYLFRTTASGDIDTSFNTGSGFDGDVTDISLDAAHRLLIAGYFSQYNGQPVGPLVRLLPNGSLDTSFNTASLIDNTVEKVLVLPSGKILISGSFSNVDGAPRALIAIINPNATLDASFDPGSSFQNGGPTVLFYTSSGKILVGGNFTDYQGASVHRVVQIDVSGARDTSFTMPANFDTVSAIYEATSGKYLIGTNGGLFALLADGSPDTAFNMGTGLSGFANSFTKDSTGRIIVAGDIWDYNGQITGPTYMIRLLADGTLDPTFTPQKKPNGVINALEWITSNRLWVGGYFSEWGNFLQDSIAILDTEGENIQQ
ncbi:delta-60 repeat domain-containing protein [Bdellovibrio bacteriovorus]|uniref:delta-60 repeat domain-containing protein n=1 Tax=Bdellovibrio bacteriovorus TaxID=959 RepID=UPI0035A70FE9